MNKPLQRLSPLLAGAVIVISGIISPVVTVGATSLDEQIQNKLNEQAAAQSQSDKLNNKADTVEEQIEKLQKQIGGIQVQIAENTKRKEAIEKQIEAAQKRLDEQQALLSANIRAMYIEGDISPIEMLASSKNLSDFVDKQEYRDRIKENITNTLDEIEQLKKELDEQRQEIDRILDEQKTLRGELRTKEGEANSKLGKINQTKAQFDKAVAQSAREIASLRAQQAAINASKNVSGAIRGSSSYPWSNVSMAYDDGCNYFSGGLGADPWGYCYRQCTSYVAWRLDKDRRSGFSGLGHAFGWANGGRSVASSNVRRGDVAIFSDGPYGHVMYVEGVSGNSVYVSQFNWPGGGYYSTMSFNKNEAIYRRF